MEMKINLPKNYVDIEEEMMYLDGGYSISWSRNTAGTVLNVAIGAITCGLGVWMNIRTLVNYFGKNTMKAYITSAISRVGIYTSIGASIASFAMTCLNFSPGNAIAYALDRYDRSGLNGYIQF